ncbi:MAG TPA: TRIC cation channel family protein [Acidimicrobiales bacterium]|nr:TRIC cation channel family protein [Acidimicrobiales bacterium]
MIGAIGALVPDPPDLATVPVGLDMAAVALGAVQGAVFATRVADERRLDIVGVAVVGIAAGLGGGIARDVLLNQLPAALSDGRLLLAAVAAALGGMVLAPLVNRIERLVVAVDAAALGLYLVVGMTKASDRGLGTVATVFVGVVACTGGSVVRDVLLQLQVAIMRVGSFYALAAVAGAVTFVVLDDVWSTRAAGSAGAAVTFALRMGAVRYGWRAPRARAVEAESIRAVGRRSWQRMRELRDR